MNTARQRPAMACHVLSRGLALVASMLLSLAVMAVIANGTPLPDSTQPWQAFVDARLMPAVAPDLSTVPART